MRVIERRIGAHAHELLRADLNERNAGIIMKVGNDMIGHNMHLAREADAINSRAVESRAPYWRVLLIPRAPAAHWLMQIRHNLVVLEKPFFRRVGCISKM